MADYSEWKNPYGNDGVRDSSLLKQQQDSLPVPEGGTSLSPDDRKLDTVLESSGFSPSRTGFRLDGREGTAEFSLLKAARLILSVFGLSAVPEKGKIELDGEVMYYTGASGTRHLVGTGTGTGDFVGPAGARDGNMVLFDGTTGKLGKDGGPVPDVSGKMDLVPTATDGNIAVFGADGQVEDGGPVPTPSNMNYRGEWAASTDYVVGDVVWDRLIGNTDSGVYLCYTAHESSSANKPGTDAGKMIGDEWLCLHYYPGPV
jgi:hypothetical protein